MRHPKGDQHWTRAHPERIKRGGDSPVAVLSTLERQAIRGYVAAHPDCNRSWLARKFGVSRPTLYRVLAEL